MAMMGLKCIRKNTPLMILLNLHWGNKKMRHYSDYFTVPQDYRPNMTREAINETPERWLDFYPHPEFEDFISTLLAVLESGDKSVWLTGNYGTGKSNAALVVQKLFMDDEHRVKSWLAANSNVLSDSVPIKEKLFARRADSTLVVYDYNASGMGPTEDFLVRLEKGIIAALRNERGLTVPAKSNLDSVIERLKREGADFFATRDKIQNRLAYLHSGIKTINQLIDELNKEHKKTDVPTRLLEDVQQVFHEDKIYLDIDVPTFRKWIQTILEANNFRSIVYIFDEFHPFIDANKAQLKTFEDVTETPGVNRFFLVPVTHMQISAYLAEGSDNAMKANDRFYFRKLQMPNDTAFKLAKHAMKESPAPHLVNEWKTERDNLWTSISGVVDKFQDDVKRESFYNILPIHPMAAFLLKFLSEYAKSNQRSLFEYLKGSADGHEFQDFIATGGPEVDNKQFLTVDYLWKYFIERKDLGVNDKITSIGLAYTQIRDREFSNQTDDAVELRVLKTVLLFCLLEQLASDGNERLKPTVENIELSFKGDGAIADPAGIVRDLAEKHCFSVVNGNIELFTTSVGGAELQEKIAKFEDGFHDFLSPKVTSMLETYTKSYRASHSGNRFEIRTSDVSHTTLNNINTTTRDKFGKDQNKDDGSVCLWFVIAKNSDEQLRIPEKINSLLAQLRDHRILMFTFPSLSFCHNNQNLWNEYIRGQAQLSLENTDAAKKPIRTSLERIEKEWFDEIKKQSASIVVYAYSVISGRVEANDTSWSAFKDLLSNYVRKSMPNCVDYLTSQITAFGNSGLKGWALAGISFNAVSGPQGQLVKGFKGQNISDTDDWFIQNPNHPLAHIHALFEKKIANTIGKASTLSVRKVYIELQRAPYGMRYNILSAFVLGFVLRDILKKNYQWTDFVQTKPLTDVILAEIIEYVVSENQKGKEKLICRLSKEDKAFIEKAPSMFGVTTLQDATIESVLNQIQNRIEDVSNRVPLWILPEYVSSVDSSQAETISTILGNVCTAFTTSSKGKTEERSNAVQDVGTAILNAPDIVNVIAGFVKSENFAKAFELYVDRTNPSLAQLATEIGDYSHDYCRAILDKSAEAAGWIWKPADISNEIEEMLHEYEVIKLAKPLCGFPNFVVYKSAVDALRNAITQTNHLPKVMIEAAYPALASFLTAVSQNGEAQDINVALSQNLENITKLFFDPIKTVSVSLLKLRLNGSAIADPELLNILNRAPSGFNMDETTFLNGIRVQIEDCAKHSVVSNLKVEWERLASGSKSPDQWALDNKIPARFLLGGLAETYDILNAIAQPEKFAAVRLSELLEISRETTAISVEECQKAFLAETVPQKYGKFNISLASLIDFLREEHGKQPNYWPRRPDISKFVRRQYKDTFAPQIAEKIRGKSAEELKRRILQLAQENEDLGLLFWED